MALVAPTNVQASDGTYTNGILVTWDYTGDLGDVGRWDIYRWREGEAPVYYTSEFGDTSYLDESVSAGVQYYYAVRAYSYSAGISSLSSSDTGYLAGSKLSGTSGNNAITGTSGADLIYGLGGNDTLKGSSGDDTIYGGSGHDRLIGGFGQDRLVGGSGSDYFVFTKLGETKNFIGGADVISGFQKGYDKIDLSAIDAKPSTASNDSFLFIGKNWATRSAGEISYQHMDGKTYIYVDNDGDSVSEAILVLDAVVNLSASDFIL